MGQLERVVKRLSDVREVWAKGELCYDVREIHHCSRHYYQYLVDLRTEQSNTYGLHARGWHSRVRAL